MESSRWMPLLQARSHANATSTTDGEAVGWIVDCPNAFSSTVRVHLEFIGEVREAHLPWADRCDGFARFLELCSGWLRISATVYGGVVVAYTLWCNAPVVEWLINTSSAVPGEMYALSALRFFSERASLAAQRIGVRQCFEADATLVPSISHWSSALPLYRSQRLSVSWIMQVEHAVETGESLEYRVDLPVTGTVAYSISRDELSTNAEFSRVRVRGGCLCDGCGTGKTAVVLAIVALQAQAKDVPPASSTVLESRATIVLCPPNLPYQWAREAQTFLSAASLSVVTLTSMREARSVTMTDLLRADIVITTPNFLRSRGLQDEMDAIVRSRLEVPDTERLSPWGRLVRLTSQRLRAEGDAALSEMPALPELVHFHRFVVDELHEYTSSSAAGRDRIRALRSVSCRMAWGLTATPDFSLEAFQEVLYPLFLQPKAGEVDPPNHHVCMQAVVRDTLMRCYSKERNEVTHRMEAVTLSARERSALAEDSLCPIERQVQLCSLPVGHGPETETIAQLLEERSHVVWRADQEVARAETTLLRASMTASGRKCVQAQCTTLQDAEQKHASLARMCAFASMRLRNVDTCTDACPVCLESPPMSILPCGHVVCAPCAERCPSRACPVCREPFERTYRVGGAVGALGTKAAAAAALIIRLVEGAESVLVFSQWKALVNVVREAIDGAIPSAILEGTAARRATLSRKFREDRSLGAMFILLDRSYAGLDFSIASSVVFLHAIVADPSDALAIEQQAIGRAARNGGGVVVHHVIATETAEEAMFQARHPSCE